MRSQPPSRPVAWANLDADLEKGTLDALRACGPRLRPGSRLHLHELLKLPDLDRARQWMVSPAAWRKGPGNVAPPSDEARALFAWLRRAGGGTGRGLALRLELLSVASPRNLEAAVLVVRRSRLEAPRRGRGVQVRYSR